MLLVKFRPDDRLVRSLDDQIEDTTAALDRAKAETTVEETTDIDPLRQSLNRAARQGRAAASGLSARRTSLTSELRDWRKRLHSSTARPVEHERLSRDVKRAEDKLVLYGQKQEEARIADALDRQKFERQHRRGAGPSVPADVTRTSSSTWLSGSWWRCSGRWGPRCCSR